MTSAGRGRFHAGPAGLKAALRPGICLIVAFTMILQLPGVASAATVTNASVNIQKIYQFMNAERATRDLPPLSQDSRLVSLAQSWANKMAAERDMYHPNTPQAMTGAGYRSGGQNLAWHDTALSASWAHNWWMNSGPHRKDILDPAFTHAGVALACNPSGGARPYVMAVVEFGGNSAPLSSTPPVSPHVAGGESVPGAGCGGSDEAPPPPPPPPAPAPAPAPIQAPPAAATTSPKQSASPAAKKASPSPSAKAAAVKTSPSASAKPPPPPASPAALPVAGTSVSPSPVTTTPAASPPANLDPVAVASADYSENRLGAILALVAGLAGILLMFRSGSRRRRVAPKHAASRRGLTP